MPPSVAEIHSSSVTPNSTSTSNNLTSNNPIQVNNFINNQFVQNDKSAYLPIYSPITSTPIGEVALSTPSDVDTAVAAAQKALPAWSSMTIKSRAAILFQFHQLVKQHADELADLIVLENGKNKAEALGDVAKGNETVEYACTAPELLPGHILKVSSQVTCQDRRDPLGVVASIVPFNFPFMVPMWTLPIALVCGNTVVLKPSEKVPLTMKRTMDLWMQAGLPKGVLNLVQGKAEVVNALIDHPDVKAVTFVGSSPVASIVSSRCRSLHKRCTALGGAKNHLIALPDCDTDSASSDIVVSFAGCAGQRCMAASVLLLVGNNKAQEELLQMVVKKASQIKPGVKAGQMGPVIDETSHKRILSFIQEAEETNGAQILLDGRSWYHDKGGSWIGPTIIRHSSPDDRAMKDEIFGPVLSVYTVSSWREAIEIENSNPFGNAAAIYTSHGGNADWFCSRFRASMLGVNIGIPVPREPFSFGGLYGTVSKYGDMDITGDAGMEFFTNRIKVTSKWPKPSAQEYLDGEKESNGTADADADADAAGVTDHANFAGKM